MGLMGMWVFFFCTCTSHLNGKEKGHLVFLTRAIFNGNLNRVHRSES